MMLATLRNVVSSGTEYSTHDHIHRRNMEMVGDMKTTEESSPCHINMHSGLLRSHTSGARDGRALGGTSLSKDD